MPNDNDCMNSLRKYFVTAIILFIGIVAVFSQGKNVIIQGYVSDKGKNPISFANIKVENTSFGGFSDINGWYRIPIKTIEDSITINYSSIGYRSISKRYKVKKLMNINILLDEYSVALNEVSVNANTLKKIQTQNIDNKSLLNISTPNNSVESVVSTLSGVSQRDELSSQYNVRGGSFDENLIYINGFNIYRPIMVRSSQQEGLSMINPDLVDNLKFSAGGFSVDYDDKASSVLDIRYKSPDDTEGSLYASLMEQRFYLGGKINNLSYLAGSRFKKINNILKTLDTKAEYNPTYFDTQIYLKYKITPQCNIDFITTLNRTKYVFIPRIRETSFGTLENSKKLKVYFDGGEKDYFNTLFSAVSLGYVSRDARIRNNISVAFHKSDESEKYDITSQYILSEDEDSGSFDDNIYPLERNVNPIGISTTRQYARNDLNLNIIDINNNTHFQINRIHLLKFGFGYRYVNVLENNDEWKMINNYGYSLPFNHDKILFDKKLLSECRFIDHRFSFYVSDRFSLKNEKHVFSFLPGIRLSYIGINKEFLFSPRLSVSYSNNDIPQMNIYANTGLYYQAPVYKEFKKPLHEFQDNYSYYNINRTLKSQGSYLFLFGAQYDFRTMSRKFKLSAELYAKYLFDINPYTYDNLKINYLGENCGSGYSIGADFKIFGEFVKDVDSWLSVGFMNSRQFIKNVSLPLMNAPIYNLSLFFSDYFPLYKPIKLNLKGVLVGGVVSLLPDSDWSKYSFYTPSYKRLDMGFSYVISHDSSMNRRKWVDAIKLKSLELGFDIYNVFDMSNVASYYWVKDTNDDTWAVPNYLTRRLWNVSIKATF